MVHTYWEPPSVRATGRTRMQLKLAAKDALFLVLNETMRRYTREMALDIGREDLTIEVAERMLSHGGERLKGRVYSDVILDHSLNLDPQDEIGWEVAQATIR